MVLMVYNTLGKKLEKFVPIRENEVRMYVCGPTVYDYIHIGNARAFIVADVVRRYLEYKGFKVKLVCNITDIDDKTISRANETGISVQQLGEFFTEAYFKDMAVLNIKAADVSPRATKHIPEIIEAIELLIKKGYAYEADGDVYFDVSKSREYGKLSGNKSEALQMGARIEINPKKKNPADFALWKAWKPNELGWHSPWGKGRPGWHIECSTMATKYLGETIDIHMGGKDLIFPHHENEVAQAEAVTGKEFARYWLHNEWLTVEGEKMSKSLGNFVTVQDALKLCEPIVLRFFLVSTHYRSTIDFNKKALKVAETNLERLINALEKLKSLQEDEVQSQDEIDFLSNIKNAKQRFEEAMDNDFNTPLAISVLFDVAKSIFSYIEKNYKINITAKREILQIFNSTLYVLGIEAITTKSVTEQSRLIDDLMQIIIDLRREKREQKDWKAADRIRRKLQEVGIELEDMPDGTIWRRKR